MSAIGFGILTSVSPCPLATNILATSYIGKHIEKSYGTLIAGLFYTIGRAAAYIVVSIIVTIEKFILLFLHTILNPIDASNLSILFLCWRLPTHRDGQYGCGLVIRCTGNADRP